MTKDDLTINFAGLTHDHTILPPSTCNNTGREATGEHDEESCSTIAILRRHPMYDCLVLVKKYRACIGGHSLEFPVDKVQPQQQTGDEMNDLTRNCSRRQIVARFLDGDDPMYQSACCKAACSVNLLDSGCNLRDVRRQSPGAANLALPFIPQIDDNGDQCELVFVPINGLLDRLKSYTESGVAVDSRVYAFAMGLKTAEKILTTNSMKELQETPI